MDQFFVLRHKNLGVAAEASETQTPRATPTNFVMEENINIMIFKWWRG